MNVRDNFDTQTYMLLNIEIETCIVKQHWLLNPILTRDFSNFFFLLSLAKTKSAQMHLSTNHCKDIDI